MMQEGVQTIDGKRVRKFLFGRQIRLTFTGGKSSAQIIEVHAFTKDHAVKRLEKAYPHVARREWEDGGELGPDHFIGRFGVVLRLDPMCLRSEGVTWT